VDAFEWSEKKRRYKSVGIDLVPDTIAQLRRKITETPIPPFWDIEPDIVMGVSAASYQLIWHDDCLFVNHWLHAMFLKKDPQELFLLRNLPIEDADRSSIEEKTRQLQQFVAASNENSELAYDLKLSRDMANDSHRRLVEYAALDNLRIARASE
jgi:hypothetical protein